MEKCQHSIKATFERVKSQIQKGADPERAVRHGYENACDYFEIMNKRILIQQRALACLSKSEAHILQRELYTMGNTGLLRREAEMTLLQPQLGDSRHQELRNSPFWPTPLFRSQSRMENTSSLKKAPLKILRVLDPIKTSPLVVSTTIRKEAPMGNAPMVAIPPKAVINRFPQVGGNRTTEASEVVFDPTQGDEGMETPPPNDSLQASLSPPVGGCLRSFRRDWLTVKCSDVLNFITNGYVLPFISKPNFSSPDSIRLQGPGPLKRPSSGLLYPVSSVKEHNRKGGKCKISRVLQSPVPCTQASPKVEASNRPKQTQHLPTCRKVQNGNTRVHQGRSDPRGMGVVDRPIRCLPSHPHPPKLKEVPKVLP